MLVYRECIKEFSYIYDDYYYTNFCERYLIGKLLLLAAKYFQQKIFWHSCVISTERRNILKHYKKSDLHTMRQYSANRRASCSSKGKTFKFSMEIGPALQISFLSAAQQESERDGYILIAELSLESASKFICTRLSSTNMLIFGF